MRIRTDVFRMIRAESVKSVNPRSIEAAVEVDVQEFVEKMHMSELENRLNQLVERVDAIRGRL